MGYQKIINFLDNTPTEPSNFRTNNWVEINDDARGTYKKNSQIRFKTSLLKSSLCDFSDTYILVNGTMKVTEAEANDNSKRLDKIRKRVIFKNCATSNGCISKINNIQIDNAKNLDVVMLMYNLNEYTDNYQKKLGSLWQHYRYDPNDNLVNS